VLLALAYQISYLLGVGVTATDLDIADGMRLVAETEDRPKAHDPELRARLRHRACGRKASNETSPGASLLRPASLLTGPRPAEGGRAEPG
jgi:hypothetical protein